MPAFATRSTAPIHNSRSGLMGFLMSTGTSAPRNASATSCTLKGFTVVRAPIHNTSISKCNASATCFAVATSTVSGKPVNFFACCSQGKPLVPMPSKLPGLVRGFQMPARNMSTFPVLCKRTAVSITCSSVSALHGPEIINGRLFHFSCTNSLVAVCVASCIFVKLFMFCPVPKGRDLKLMFCVFIFLCYRLYHFIYRLLFPICCFVTQIAHLCIRNFNQQPHIHFQN